MVVVLSLLAACAGPPSLPPPPLATSTAPDRPAPLPPEAGDASGPAGTSGQGATRYDAVGYASWYGEDTPGTTASGTPFDPQAITAAHRTLPLGSVAEVTALDTGRTILVLVNDRGPSRPDREIDLSRAAAQALGTDTNPLAPVRVRAVTASPQDAAALAQGRPAAARLDAPPALLAALRRDLKTYRAPTPPPRTRAPRAAAPLEAGRYIVQVAAFSSQDRAAALAKALNGRVEPGGGLHRVRLGPFADAASAERARDGAARRGYGYAQIIVQ